MNSSAPPSVTQSWLELPDGRLFWLKERCTIGRQVGNDLIFSQTSLSRSHALLTAVPSGYILTDLHSSNGTYVNRELIKRPHQLRDGDVLQLGDVALKYRCTRRFDPSETQGRLEVTRRIDDVRPRNCWLLVADFAGFSALSQELGSEAALRRLQAWITDMRPLLERNGATINGYVGDAIFAYWPCDTTAPARVLAALQGMETLRLGGTHPFRTVVHHGSVLFSKSEHGEELSGHDVNFLFRSEKIAKRFRVSAMLSAPAVSSLNLTGECPSLDQSAVDGLSGEFAFFGFPGGNGPIAQPG